MSRIEVTDEQIREAQSGNETAMWDIVSAHDPMVKSIIQSVAPSAGREDREDMLQDGRAVLIEHIRRYDRTVNAASLTTFAYRAVRHAIAEAWLTSSSGMTIEVSAVLRVRSALAAAEGDVEAAWAELHGSSSLTRETFMAALDALSSPESLDAPMLASPKSVAQDGAGFASLRDTIADPTADITSPTERRDLARWLVTQIAPRQSYALRAYYGIQMTAVPDAEAAGHLQTTAANVRVLRKRGVDAAKTVAAAHRIVA
ncbi:sigma factor [Streptomyces tubercidicus]